MRRPRADGLFDRIATFGALCAAASRAALGKRRGPGPAAFLANLETEVLRLERELRSGTWRPGGYVSFEIRDPKRRTSSAAPFGVVCGRGRNPTVRVFTFERWADTRPSAWRRRPRGASGCGVRGVARRGGGPPAWGRIARGQSPPRSGSPAGDVRQALDAARAADRKRAGGRFESNHRHGDVAIITTSGRNPWNHWGDRVYRRRVIGPYGTGEGLLDPARPKVDLGRGRPSSGCCRACSRLTASAIAGDGPSRLVFLGPVAAQATSEQASREPNDGGHDGCNVA